MRKCIAFLLIGTMLACLSACGGSTAGGSDGDSVKLVWWVYNEGDVPKDMDIVLERANQISAEKIGVTVDMRFKTEEQFELDMNTGEDYDMTFTCDWCNDFDNNAQKGYYYDVTDLVKSETPVMYDTVDPWWEIGTVNDRIYGVPMLKDLGAEVFFRLNSDYYENEKGMTLPEEMKFEELEPLLAMWKKDHTDVYPLELSKGGLSGMSQVHEEIAWPFVIPYSKAGTPEGTKVIPVWEDKEYMDMLRNLHKWYDMGYINPDAATTTEVPYSVKCPVRSGTAWNGYLGWSDPELVGFNVKLARYLGPNLSRATEQGSLIAINAAASEERAKACLKYMELLYTDRELRDTLAYGLEGEHFIYKGGTAIRTQKGVDNYVPSGVFVTGPVISASVLSASEDMLADPDQWEKVYEGYKTANVSDTKGFSYDGKETEDIQAAISAIRDNYEAELLTGTIDPDLAMEEIREKVDKAGFEKLRKDVQGQLDAYLESQKR
jgi:ABC-type glycerol-3-phosphate transport system substrate-binding protein